MAEKVYLIFDYWEADERAEYPDEKDFIDVCDSFESACNRIRKCLLDRVAVEETRYNNCPYCVERMSFDEFFQNRSGYCFDPASLPTNEDIANNFVYQEYYYTCRFCVEEREIKHYD